MFSNKERIGMESTNLNALLALYGIRISVLKDLSDHGITNVAQLGRSWRRERSELEFLFRLRNINKASMTKFLNSAAQIYVKNIQDEARSDFFRPTVRPMLKKISEVNGKADSSDRDTPITQQPVQIPPPEDNEREPKEINTPFSSTHAPYSLEEENGFCWSKVKRRETNEYNAVGTKVQRPSQPLNSSSTQIELDTLQTPLGGADLSNNRNVSKDNALSLRQKEVVSASKNSKGREMMHAVHSYFPIPEVNRKAITEEMKVEQHDAFLERRNQETKLTRVMIPINTRHELGNPDVISCCHSISQDIGRDECVRDILQEQINEAQERLRRFRAKEQETRLAAEEEERKIKELQQRQTLKIPARESKQSEEHKKFVTRRTGDCIQFEVSSNLIPSLQPTNSTIPDAKSTMPQGNNSSSLTMILRAFHQAPDTISKCETMGLMTLTDLIQAKESTLEDIIKGLKPIPRKKFEVFVKEAREGRVSDKGNQDTHR